jgi:hypothetical protein
LALVPEGIAKAEEIVPHENLQACDDGRMWNTNAEGRGPKEVSDDFQGVICVNVSIH